MHPIEVNIHGVVVVKSRIVHVLNGSGWAERMMKWNISINGPQIRILIALGCQCWPPAREVARASMLEGRIDG